MASWTILDARGQRLGDALAPTERRVLALAAARWPFAAYPLRAVLLAGTPRPDRTHGLRRPEVIARATETKRRIARARLAREAALPPEMRFKIHLRRKKEQRAKWKRYYRQKLGLPPEE
jgi:hypothetical protein